MRILCRLKGLITRFKNLQKKEYFVDNLMKVGVRFNKIVIHTYTQTSLINKYYTIYTVMNI